MHALNSQHVPYVLSAYWLEWTEHPTSACSVCMPIRRANFKVRGVK